MNRLLLRATNPSLAIHPGFFRFDMPILHWTRRLIGHGRALLRYHFEDFYNKTPIFRKLDRIHFNKGSSNVTTGSHVLPQGSPTPGPLDWIGEGIHNHVRRIFVNNVLRRATSSLSSGLQQRARQQLLYANNARPFFALIGVSLASGAGVLTRENEFEGICWEIRESVEKKQRQLDHQKAAALEREEVSEPLSVNSLEFGPLIAKGCSGVVYSARWKGNENTVKPEDAYPLGVKMLFNYFYESSSAMIIRSMWKEIVPAINIEGITDVSTGPLESMRRCPPHPNIVEISNVFTDQVPMLPDSLENFSDALPKRLNEAGFGRNMSLFLVMKRYDTNLHDYLHHELDLKLKNRILILTQLLEGVAHLSANEIAHRDLKTDNILLEISSDPKYPHLVITDFGCCLADKSHGLHLPFPSAETDRGGNAALMAPEVSAANPGVWRKISYEKSDAWSVGTIAYEIFGEPNPFVSQSNEDGRVKLDSIMYSEKDLPLIPSVPPLINHLVHGLLRRNPSERLSAELAATICHIYLWGPTRWFFVETQHVTGSEITQWLLTLTTKLLCQMPSDSLKSEFTVIRTFLKRVRFGIVRSALEWIQLNILTPVK